METKIMLQTSVTNQRVKILKFCGDDKAKMRDCTYVHRIILRNRELSSHSDNYAQLSLIKHQMIYDRRNQIRGE